jgi:hypothetical protein
LKPLKLIPFITLVLFSCVGNPKEGQNTVNALSEESKAELSTELSMDASQKLREARRIKGDTLAMSYLDLQKYLPKEINGYIAQGNPKGEYMDIPGMAFSQAEQIYKKGDSQLVISLFDYNSAYDMYAGATALFAGAPVQNNEETAKGLSMKDQMKGWESYKKKEKRAELMLGIAERFYLNIKADKQEGTELIKNIADKMDLSGLNNM